MAPLDRWMDTLLIPEGTLQCLFGFLETLVKCVCIIVKLHSLQASGLNHTWPQTEFRLVPVVVTNSIFANANKECPTDSWVAWQTCWWTAPGPLAAPRWRTPRRCPRLLEMAAVFSEPYLVEGVLQSGGGGGGGLESTCSDVQLKQTENQSTLIQDDNSIWIMLMDFCLFILGKIVPVTLTLLGNERCEVKIQLYK